MTVSTPRAQRRARVRELVHPQQDLFSPASGLQLCVPPVPSPAETLRARAELLRFQAESHTRLQRSHARQAAALLAEALRLEEEALQLSLPLKPATL